MKIDKRAIKRIIVHRNCPDGIASAMLLKDVCRSATVEEIAYGSERDGLEITEGMIFCDMTPPEHLVEEAVSAGAYVLDHHVSQKETVVAFGERGVYSDKPGVSGAVLAFQMWAQHKSTKDLIRTNRFVTLVGIRDTWQRQHTDWSLACATSTALTHYGMDTMLRIRKTYLSKDQLDVGKALYRETLNTAARIAQCDCSQYGDVVLFNGNPRKTSDVADSVRAHNASAKILAGYLIVGDEVQVSMRAISNDVDVSEIAKRNGGGGHRAAAGFFMECPDEHVVKALLKKIS